MQLLAILEQNPWFLISVVGIFSLLIGSFLNAAIYRIPIMMQREWDAECKAHMNADNPDYIPETLERFNLFIPRSRCPTCGHQISAIENIPILSYLIQRGKCKGCKTKISKQYPIVEALTAAISMFIAWKFGYCWPMAAMLLFAWTLITLGMIDAKTMLLPDSLTLPLMWLGLLFNLNGMFVSLHSAVLGAVIGYMSLWSIFQLFRLVTGKDGMGYGDFKILAAIGAWGGWQILPFTIFASALLGAVVGITMMKIQQRKDSQPIPYGPWLALAGLISLLWRDDIVNGMMAYFKL
ncbi:MAG: prepilin peptidase [Proteobacteria bacterium]|nr:MAG: prepilin peptidase [Pseudomonadota bacterium]